MMNALTLSVALALDWLFGEPRRFHPLVGFGRLAQALERRLRADSYAYGSIAVLLLIAPFTLSAMLIDLLPWGGVMDAALLYLAIGWRSLSEHAWRVRDAMLADDLPVARQQVSFMVSRDAATLDQEGVAKAVVESVLENGNDAIFGVIFWFMVAGAPGVVLYRLANTLDAMWGYRNERYLRFGWAAARLDDVLNFVPARLTAFGYALSGSCGRALRCWHSQGLRWKSPNAGPVMAAGAGSLGVTLGGAAIYGGVMQMRPALGEGRRPEAGDIDRALRLIRRSLLLWLGVVLFGGPLVEFANIH